MAEASIDKNQIRDQLLLTYTLKISEDIDTLLKSDDIQSVAFNLKDYLKQNWLLIL